VFYITISDILTVIYLKVHAYTRI